MSKCQYCDKKLDVQRTGRKKYCNDKCRQEYHNEKRVIIKKCKVCGIDCRTKYCSVDCRKKARKSSDGEELKR